MIILDHTETDCPLKVEIVHPDISLIIHDIELAQFDLALDFKRHGMLIHRYYLARYDNSPTKAFEYPIMQDTLVTYSPEEKSIKVGGYRNPDAIGRDLIHEIEFDALGIKKWIWT